MTISQLRRDHPVLHPGLRHDYQSADAATQAGAEYVDTSDLYPDSDAAAVAARERVFAMANSQSEDHREMLRGWASL